MTGKIYLIRNLINGKGYVGQTTKSLFVRFNRHKYDANKGSDCALHKAFRKYGFENFDIKEVVSCDSLLLDDLEKHYIKFYGTYAPTGHGYNLTEGGDGSLEGRVFSKEGREKLTSVHKGNSYAKGHKVSDEARAIMSSVQKNRRHHSPSEEERKRISETLKGHPVSEETRAKISAVQLGKKRGPMSEDTKKKISQSKKGKKLGPMREDIKAKISAGSKGKKIDPKSIAKRTATRAKNGFTLSEEARTKISETLTGRKLPKEHREKITAGLKRAWKEKLSA